MYWHSVDFRYYQNDHVTIESKMPVRLSKITSKRVVSNRMGEAQLLAIVEDPSSKEMIECED
jgi:hypothetical protein